LAASSFAAWLIVINLHASEPAQSRSALLPSQEQFKLVVLAPFRGSAPVFWLSWP
jgi:hypothetical protein